MKAAGNNSAFPSYVCHKPKQRKTQMKLVSIKHLKRFVVAVFFQGESAVIGEELQML